jgi:EAL domain-containing protein (putative c-di-GMP-specific phosphodiesterase class I)
MGSSLALAVVAEGVEREEQLRRLRELGCEFGQGFHFARPMDAEQMLAYLSAPTPTHAAAVKQLVS